MSTCRIVASSVASPDKPQRLTSDRVYQGMTIVAVILLLASLWAF